MDCGILGNKDTVLSVENVSKKYCMNLRQLRQYGFRDILSSIFELSKNKEQLRPGEFWAVKDVSFSMNRGESIGIIGLNGAGKSTLLKMIKGLIMPDIGNIRINGEVGALIELGAGFHPMLSGKENIYIKGALLGKTKEKMEAIYEDIVEFAELGKFIDSPLKSYSSGMHVRLGFAISIFMEPDLLLLDEVLAVGDFKFRQKCLDRINRLKDKTSTIFVSHSMSTVSLFCERAIVLEKGNVGFEGNADDAIRYYMAEIERNGKENKKSKVEKKVKQFYGDLFLNDQKIMQVEHFWSDSEYNRIVSAETGDEINIVIRFKLKVKPKRGLIVGVPIWDKNGVLITGISTDMDQIEIEGEKNKHYELILNFKELVFNPNEYIAVIAISDGIEIFYRDINNPLTVENYKRNFGYFTANHKWLVQVESESKRC